MILGLTRARHSPSAAMQVWRHQCHTSTNNNNRKKRKIKSTGEDETEIGDNVQRSQLIVQTLSKVIGQLDPKVYGEKITHAGDAEQPLEVVIRRVGAKSE